MKHSNVFAETINQGERWLNEISAEMGGVMPHDYALQALRAALHALRDELTVQQIAHLSAQLPIIVRGYYYEDWHPSKTPARERHEEHFLARIPPYFHGKDPVPDPEDVVRTVFKVLHHNISPGQSKEVYNALPKHVRQYWPAQAVYGEVVAEVVESPNPAP